MPRCTITLDGLVPKDILSEKFWAHVQSRPEDTCWLWRGTIAKNGYGKLYVGYHQISAHRVAYELLKGPIPAGLFVLHHCDVRSCCNPDHLWLGTALENIRDCKNKGRLNNGSRKLTEEDVVKIQHLSLGGMNSFEIAERFGVGAACIRNILTGITWKDLK